MIYSCKNLLADNSNFWLGLLLVFLNPWTQPLIAQASHFLELPGVTLHYRDLGEGLPVLLINGGPGMSSEGFLMMAGNLAENNRVILFDQRGTGLSELDVVNDSTVTMDRMVADIEALRRHLGINRWVVMGHSFGGILAYYYASKYPDRLLGMIQSSSGGMDLELLATLDIPGGLTPVEQDSLRYYNRRIQRGDTTHATRLKRGEFLAPAYVYHREHIPVVAERLTQGNRTINRLVWQDLRRMGYDVKSQMRMLACPVLILHGRQDIVSPELAGKAHRILQDSRLVILEESKHYGWLDNPGGYFAAIEEFLGMLRDR
ncbi:alpha/beta fold hydrolase [Robiginitalea biformata]|uniref:alpha/beta fold hydrolase n=1 Tax=Robiginitalea biformata TaxID=252307 RepID=UPI0003234353|nr:alpha/beta hydrolase [Robiginitalea biformata]